MRGVKLAGVHLRGAPGLFFRETKKPFLSGIKQKHVWHKTCENHQLAGFCCLENISTARNAPAKLWQVAKKDELLNEIKGHGGEDGIRTHDTLLTYTPLAGERLRPLGHLSGAA